MKKSIYIPVLLLICFFSIIFLTNTNAPFCPDDYIYYFQFDDNVFFGDTENITYKTIDSIQNYFSSVKNIYLKLTGRITAHSLLQALLQLPPWVFDLLNTFIVFVFCYLVGFLALGKKFSNKISLIALILPIFYLTSFVTLRNFYKPAFSCNYLWMLSYLFAFLLPYRFYLDDFKYKNKSIFFAIFMLLAGIIVGNTNEPTIPAVAFTLFIYIVTTYKQKKSLWFYTGFIGLIIGFAILYFSPGNNIRWAYEIKEHGANPNKFNLSLINLKTILLVNIYSFPIYIIGLISFLKRKTKVAKSNKLTIIAMFLMFFIVVAIMSIVPSTSKRLGILYIPFLLVACINLFKNSKIYNKKNVLFLTIILAIPFTIKLIGDYNFYKLVATETKTTEAIIKSNTAKNIEIPKKVFFNPITNPSMKKSVANYYNKNTINYINPNSKKYLDKGKKIDINTITKHASKLGIFKITYSRFNKNAYILHFYYNHNVANAKVINLATRYVKNTRIPFAENLLFAFLSTFMYNYTTITKLNENTSVFDVEIPYAKKYKRIKLDMYIDTKKSIKGFIDLKNFSFPD